MKAYMCMFIFVIFSITSSLSALSSTDRQKITQIVEHGANAWNNQGGRGFADYYSEDADFVNIFGMVFAGKKEIETRHIKILQTFLKGSTFEVLNVKLREAKPGMVIAIVQWQVTNIQNPSKASTDTMKGVFTHVFLKKKNNWEITATQNTTIAK